MMKMNRFWSAATASVLAFGGLTLNSMPVKKVCAVQYGDSSLGEYVPELLELYKEYHKNDSISMLKCENIIEIYFEEATSDGSVFTVIEREPDTGQIQFYVGSEDVIDLETLRGLTGFNEDEMYLEINYFAPDLAELSMKFYTNDHNANYNAALRMTEYIEKDYQVDTDYSYIYLEQVLKPKTKIYTVWNDMTRIDEYGIKAPLSEELTTKQLKALNEEIADNGFKAVIDADTGGIIFDDTETEVEKFTFALWFEENYGFHANIDKLSFSSYGYLSQQVRQLYYTDLLGDVNNDEKVNLSDLVMLSRFLLNDRELINPKNADICEDSAIDGFDLTLLREKLINNMN